MNIFCELSTELLCCNELCRVISEKNQAILPTHELVIFTKFHNDWVKIRDIRSVFDLIPIIITILIQATQAGRSTWLLCFVLAG